jgi:hypothetical protein
MDWEVDEVVAELSQPKLDSEVAAAERFGDIKKRAVNEV